MLGGARLQHLELSEEHLGEGPGVGASTARRRGLLDRRFLCRRFLERGFLERRFLERGRGLLGWDFLGWDFLGWSFLGWCLRRSTGRHGQLHLVIRQLNQLIRQKRS
ncbi:hypothetical protein SGFS_058240 [Streptomyces graminofaciens]|uniref:Uncharacterized protein n=1 Tax=Streptomyces graminofaciens TaxID=68212 RepID=A0ABN5VMN7_9ACTN|nr:hypothetical protein SGFS_058240 [Streptomyces graminofaciens]